MPACRHLELKPMQCSLDTETETGGEKALREFPYCCRNQCEDLQPSLLLSGVHGCGKSSLCRAATASLNMHYFQVGICIIVRQSWNSTCFCHPAEVAFYIRIDVESSSCWRWTVTSCVVKHLQQPRHGSSMRYTEVGAESKFVWVPAFIICWKFAILPSYLSSAALTYAPCILALKNIECLGKDRDGNSEGISPALVSNVGDYL